MSAIVLFDGTCNLCDHAVQFVLDHERDHELRFVALQSTAGRAVLLRACGEEETERLVGGASGTGDPDTIVVVEGTHVFLRSDGALRIARHLRAPWRWLAAATVIPRGLRDVFYRAIAGSRYRLFGRLTSCRVPTPELRARFLE